MECPNCKAQLALTPEFPEQQVMYFSINHEHELLMAKTVSGTMANAEKLLIEIGKSMGVKVQVFLHSIEQKPKELKFGLLLTTAGKVKTPNVEVSGLAPLAAEGPLDCRVGPHTEKQHA
jgi:hypothetical protein